MKEALFPPIILKDLNAAWAKVLHLGTQVNFKRNQILAVDENYNANGAYFIKEGCIRLSYIAPNGQEKVLFFIGKGSLFNEVPSVSPSSPCIFTSVTPTTAVYFKKSLVTSPRFAVEHPEVVLNWVESTSIKTGCLFRQLCDVGLFDVFTNVCRLLYTMAQHHKEHGKIVPHLSQQECASYLGIHRGSLHKALSRLKDEGVIESYSRHELRILNMEQLREYASPE